MRLVLADMVRLFEIIDKASGLFVQERTPTPSRCSSESSPAIRTISTQPSGWRRHIHCSGTNNRPSMRSDVHRASPAVDRCSNLLGLHYARGRDWQPAAPLLEQVIAEAPERLVAIDALAAIREREGNRAAALALRQKAEPSSPPPNWSTLATSR